MDLHSFDTLANELVQHIAGFLDAQTLLSFVSTSHQYKQFEYPVQEHWKILYANNWCVDLQELECYEKDWKNEYKTRYLREKDFVKQVNDVISNNTEELTGTEEDPLIVSVDQFLQLVVTFGASYDPWHLLLRAQNNVHIEKVVLLAEALYDRGSLSDIKREVEAHRLEILISAARRLSLSNIEVLNVLHVLQKYLFNDLLENAEMPVGFLSLLKDILFKKKLYDNVEGVLQKMLKYKTNYPKSFWLCMGFVSQLISLIINEKDQTTRFQLMHVLAFYSPTKTDPNFVGVQLVRTITADFNIILKQQETHELELFQDLILGVLQPGLDQCIELGLIDQLIDFSPTNSEYFGKQIAFIANICSLKRFKQLLGQNKEFLDYMVQFCLQHYEEPSNGSLEDCLFIIGEIIYYSDEAYVYIFQAHLDNLLQALIPVQNNVEVTEQFNKLLKNFIGRSMVHNCATVLNEKLMEHYDIFASQLLQHYSIRFWQSFILIATFSTKQAVQVATRFLTALENDSKTMGRETKACIVSVITNLIIKHNYAFQDLDLTKSLVVLVDELLIDGRKSKKFDPFNYFSDHYPYALKLLASYAHFPHLSKLMIKNSKLLNKLYELADDPEEPPETQYLLAFLFSCVVVTHKDWKAEKPLKCIERFATEVPISVKFVFVFPTIEPFKFLFNEKNAPEVILFAAWTLGRVAFSMRLLSRDNEPTTNISDEIDDEIITWLDNYPHPKMEGVMKQFHELSDKKSLVD